MTLPDVLPLIGLEGISLLHGSHANRGDGVCLLEAVAWLVGEPHSDHPKCVCPVLAAFGRRLNDRIRDEVLRTNLLRPIVPLLVGTKSTRAVELKRAFLATDWAVRIITPQWLDLRDDLKAHAVALRGLPPLDSADACKSALGTIRQARSDGYDAAAAAYAADAADDAAAYAADDAAAYAADAYDDADAAAAAAAAAAAYAYAADADAAADAAAAAYAAYADTADKRKQIADLRDAQFAMGAQLLRDMIAITA